MGISKKIIGSQGIGFVLFILLSIFSYISLTSYSHINKRSIALTGKAKLSANFQLLLQKILMPPNDYLITGDKNERQNFAYLLLETASVLERLKVVSITKNELAVIEKAEMGICFTPAKSDGTFINSKPNWQ